MYKSVKISESAYRQAKKLRKDLEKTESYLGIHKVSLSEAINFAILNTANKIERRRLKDSASGWSDIDQKIIKEIYKTRLDNSTRCVEL
ncbi:MAG: hypothetical protein GF334_07660 [Candidatus Altiarchaeales archaeon]|nr:hypothetical protein [Candidatus Altiarchaeales archaeon]